MNPEGAAELLSRPLNSASNIYRRLLCPGSAGMENGRPDIKTAESEQGDRLHAYRAHPEYERKLLSQGEQDLLRLSGWLERQIFQTIPVSGDYSESREVALADSLISGHPDLLRVYQPPDGPSVIIDDKFGWSPVPAADVNLQLRVYAILSPSSPVYVAISQPRLAIEDRITIAKYTQESKEASRSQIATILKRTEDPKAPLVPGQEQCRYCRARVDCPALRDAVTKQLAQFEGLKVKGLSKTKLLSLIEERLSIATDDQIGLLYGACALARVVNDPLVEEVRKRIEKGGMEGFSVAKDFDVRVITDLKRAVSLLVLGGIRTRNEIFRRCRISLDGIEEDYREATGASAKEAKAEVNRVLDSVIEKETRRGRILRK